CAAQDLGLCHEQAQRESFDAVRDQFRRRKQQQRRLPEDDEGRTPPRQESRGRDRNSDQQDQRNQAPDAKHSAVLSSRPRPSRRFAFYGGRTYPRKNWLIRGGRRGLFLRL